MDQLQHLLSVDGTHYAEGMRVHLADGGGYGGGYTVTIPVHGALEALHRGRAVDADPARAVVFQPDGEADLHCGPDSDCYAVRVDAPALADVLEHRLGHEVRRPLVLAVSLDLRTPAGRTWTALVRVLVSSPVLRHPVLADPVQETVLSRLLRAVEHPYRGELDAPIHSWGPGPARRMVDAVEAAPRHPFTGAELADVAGVSVPTLTECCRRHLDVRPAEHLRAVRMGHAHRELEESDADRTTVADVASRWGFANEGRFTTAYGQRYGVPPAQTLRGPAYA
jgi:AraC-like DNA-binding protein